MNLIRQMIIPLAIYLLWCLCPPWAQADTLSIGTRFGTFANFRQSAGSVNFITGKSYQVVDGDNYKKNQVYRFIGPDGKPVVQSNDWRQLIQHQPDAATREWWEFQLKQMIAAGLDFVAIDSFGRLQPYECDECSENDDPKCKKDSHNSPLQPEFQAEAIKKIFLEDQLPLKVALFVDTGDFYMYNWDRLKAAYGEPSKWCRYRFLEPGDGNDPLKVIQPMPVTPENAVLYIYKDTIYPFYSRLNDPKSRQLWLTQNGKSPDEGGRPIVVFYGSWPQLNSSFEQTGSAFQAIKTHFQKDFGVEPFLVIDLTWFRLSKNDPLLMDVADAQEEFLPSWLWGRNEPLDQNSRLYKNFRVSRIVPGLKAPPGHWGPQNRITQNPKLGKRWMFLDGTEGPDESYFLEREWQSGMKDHPDLAIIGFWDDQEGETIAEMADYEKKDGGFLSPDYYIKKVRALIDHYRQTGQP